MVERNPIRQWTRHRLFLPIGDIPKFDGSIRTAVQAKDFVDQLWLYDNTARGRSPRLLAWFQAGNARDTSHDIPDWAKPFFA